MTKSTLVFFTMLFLASAAYANQELVCTAKALVDLKPVYKDNKYVPLTDDKLAVYQLVGIEKPVRVPVKNGFADTEFAESGPLSFNAHFDVATNMITGSVLLSPYHVSSVSTAKGTWIKASMYKSTLSTFFHTIDGQDALLTQNGVGLPAEKVGEVGSVVDHVEWICEVVEQARP